MMLMLMMMMMTLMVMNQTTAEVARRSEEVSCGEP